MASKKVSKKVVSMELSKDCPMGLTMAESLVSSKESVTAWTMEH